MRIRQDVSQTGGKATESELLSCLLFLPHSCPLRQVDARARKLQALPLAAGFFLVNAVAWAVRGSSGQGCLG